MSQIKRKNGEREWDREYEAYSVNLNRLIYAYSGKPRNEQEQESEWDKGKL
jgi:hypothetical protein